MMISFASKAKRLEMSCVQLTEVKSTVFSELVCDLFSFTNWAIAGNQSSTVTMAAKTMSDIITWKKPGVASSPFVLIFMQITSDPMRGAKLLFDLKDCVRRFSFGIHVSAIACKTKMTKSKTLAARRCVSFQY